MRPTLLLVVVQKLSFQLIHFPANVVIFILNLINFVGTSRMLSENGNQYGDWPNFLPKKWQILRKLSEICETEKIIHYSIHFFKSLLNRAAGRDEAADLGHALVHESVERGRAAHAVAA